MSCYQNPFRGIGLGDQDGLESGEIFTDPVAAKALFAHCPVAHKTPLTQPQKLANQLGIAALHLKDERQRLGLGSFKALGAAHAIAKLAVAKSPVIVTNNPQAALKDVTFVCASAGNHGLSMAAGAQVFGARAVVYIAETVPDSFAKKLRGKGAKVIRQGENYEASMRAAQRAAQTNHWTLLSDSTWPGYHRPARDVMEGYLIIAQEVVEAMPTPPTHIFLQAGVGGLAAACTAVARRHWRDAPKICIVEPDAAPALFESIKANAPLTTTGPVSNMGRLDCKEPSHLALKYLALNADFFMTISDEEANDAVAALSAHGIATTPSGAAGLAGLLNGGSNTLGIDENARVLAYVTETTAG